MGEKTKQREHPLYTTWAMMRQRCNNPNATSAPWYHDMGIRVCDEWNADFWAFVRDMGEKPDPSYTLDRMNPWGNYEPENCRWASRTLQHHNKRGKLGRKANKPRGLRTHNRLVEYQGQMVGVKELAERLDLDYQFFINRLNLGYTVEEARDIPKFKPRRTWNRDKMGGESAPQ